jgi:hypothetical protein
MKAMFGKLKKLEPVSTLSGLAASYIAAKHHWSPEAVFGVGVTGKAAGVIVNDALLKTAVEINFEHAILSKLKQDFRNGVLTSDETQFDSYKELFDKLQASGLLASSRVDIRIPPCLRQGSLPVIPPAAFTGHISHDALRTATYSARSLGRDLLVVDIQAVHLGALSMLHALSDVFCLPISVRHHAPAKLRDLISSGVEHEDADFIVCADADMFIVASAKTKYNYRLLTPLFKQPQFLVRSSRGSCSHVQLSYPLASSGEEQFLAQREVLVAKGLRDHKGIEFDDLSVMLQNMGRDEALLCWDPLVSYYEADHDLNRQEIPGYRVGTSIYCHKRWFEPHMDKDRLAALEAFAAAWNYARNNLAWCVLWLASSPKLRQHLRAAISSNPKISLDFS